MDQPFAQIGLLLIPIMGGILGRLFGLGLSHLQPKTSHVHIELKAAQGAGDEVLMYKRDIALPASEATVQGVLADVTERLQA